METDRPLCKCHGEPMHRDGFKNGKQTWRCSVKNREHFMAYYEGMSGVQWNAYLLGLRRWKAEKRARQRKERNGSLSAEG